MSNKRISQLPEGNLNSNTIFPIVTDGITSQTTLNNINDYITSNFTTPSLFYYKAIINQSLSDDPIVNVLINETPFNITILRSNIGVYTFSIENNLPISNLYLNVANNSQANDANIVSYYDLNTKNNSYDFYIYTSDTSGFVDDIMYNTFIEIGIKFD